MTQQVAPLASRDRQDVAKRETYSRLYGPPLQRAFTSYTQPRSHKGGSIRYAK